MHPPPPRSTLFPYTTLFRSSPDHVSIESSTRNANAITRAGIHSAGCRRKAENENVDASSGAPRARDRKSTRLNSSHITISYAVFCLKKKKKKTQTTHRSTDK